MQYGPTIVSGAEFCSWINDRGWMNLHVAHYEE